MRKKQRGPAILILFLLLIVLSILLYLLAMTIIDLNAKQIELVAKPAERNQPSYDGQLQFYPNMRFAENNITYFIDPACSLNKVESIDKSLMFLENETGLLRFYNSDENSEIVFSCDEAKNSKTSGGSYFIAGEGGPTEIINTSEFYLVQKGKVLLFYKNSGCNNYNIELHELLHVFGFEHSSNPNSIMYSITSCNQVLTNDILAELKRLYSIKSLPDLYFSNISASKHGGYLDFKAEIRNGGLKDAANISLIVYSNKEETRSFRIGDMDTGTGEVFYARNVPIDRGSVNIEIAVVDGQEIDKQNNIEELFLPSQ